MELKDVKKIVPENLKNAVPENLNELKENVQQYASEKLPRDWEKKVPDAFESFPKFISPEVHKWLDVSVAGYFGVLGAVFAFQGKKGAATAAFVNAGMVAGVSAFTDYRGDYEKPISFKLHGTLDAVQAATAALAPVLHGFADGPEAWFFYGQSINEAAVIAFTDWDEAERDQAALMEKSIA